MKFSSSVIMLALLLSRPYNSGDGGSGGDGGGGSGGDGGGGNSGDGGSGDGGSGGGSGGDGGGGSGGGDGGGDGGGGDGGAWDAGSWDGSLDSVPAEHQAMARKIASRYMQDGGGDRHRARNNQRRTEKTATDQNNDSRSNGDKDFDRRYTARQEQLKRQERIKSWDSSIDSVMDKPVTVGNATLSFATQDEQVAFSDFVNSKINGGGLSGQDMYILHNLPKIIAAERDHAIKELEKKTSNRGNRGNNGGNGGGARKTGGGGGNRSQEEGAPKSVREILMQNNPDLVEDFENNGPMRRNFNRGRR